MAPDSESKSANQEQGNPGRGPGSNRRRRSSGRSRRGRGRRGHSGAQTSEEQGRQAETPIKPQEPSAQESTTTETAMREAPADADLRSPPEPSKREEFTEADKGGTQDVQPEQEDELEPDEPADIEAEEPSKKTAEEQQAEEELWEKSTPAGPRSRPEPTPAAPRPSRSYDEPSPPRRPEPRGDFRPADPASVKEAIEEVNRIIDTLRNTLDDMEEVLETLELAERQKDADEHEIESLRRALRGLQRPRDQGHHRR